MTYSKSGDTTLNLIAYGTSLVTIFLITNILTDPVNVTKLVPLSGLGFGILAVLLTKDYSFIKNNHKAELIFIFFFFCASVSALFFSKSPLSQNFYGVYGRNTGFLAYFSLSICFLGCLLANKVEQIRKIYFGLLFAGTINVLYCAWVLLFGDFIGWYNPYGNILGLFGNPNFISAFLGIFIAASLGMLLQRKLSVKIRVGIATFILVAFYEILASKAIQGIFVTIVGVGIVLFFKIRESLQSRLLNLSYLGISFVLAFLVLLGTLQKGPFSFIYKKSVSLRGTYWHTGIDIGSRYPLTGVGFDSYGDWYRRMRPPVALVDMPGLNTTSNSAHNVMIDIFAFGGLPLLFAYLMINIFVLVKLAKFVRSNLEIDGFFVGLIAAWICYHVQSLVSINQIGLAIWGWILGGSILSYIRIKTFSGDDQQHKNRRIEKRRQKVSQNSVFSPKLISGIGIVVGIFIAFPPLRADINWFSAINSRNVQKVEQALEPSYMNPVGSFRYSEAVNLFDTSNLNDLAYKYAKISTKFNPEYFDSWRQLYFLTPSSAEKRIAIANMRRLDPLNPDVTAP